MIITVFTISSGANVHRGAVVEWTIHSGNATASTSYCTDSKPLSTVTVT